MNPLAEKSKKILRSKAFKLILTEELLHHRRSTTNSFARLDISVHQFEKKQRERSSIYININRSDFIFNNCIISVGHS